MIGVTNNNQEGNMRLCTIDIGDKCRTKSGLYFEHRGNLCFRNELGRHVYPKDYDEECEILESWPYLSENENFVLKQKVPLISPCQHLLFETEQGFRFIQQLENFKLAIPFWFNSTDPRVGKAKAEWTVGSGKAIAEMFGHNLYITYELGTTPKLHIQGRMIIPKQ